MGVIWLMGAFWYGLAVLGLMVLGFFSMVDRASLPSRRPVRATTDLGGGSDSAQTAVLGAAISTMASAARP